VAAHMPLIPQRLVLLFQLSRALARANFRRICNFGEQILIGYTRGKEAWGERSQPLASRHCSNVNRTNNGAEAVIESGFRVKCTPSHSAILTNISLSAIGTTMAVSGSYSHRDEIDANC